MKNATIETTITDANRALYGTARRRTFFFKGLTILLAVQMFFFGMAPAAWATVLSDLMGNPANVNEDGSLKAGAYRGLDGGTFMDGNDHVTITGSGRALFQTPEDWTISGGELTYIGGLVYLLAGGGISFSGGTFNVDGLIAAAIGKSDFQLGDKLTKGDVTESISGDAGGSGFRVYIGKTVGATGGTIVETDGMEDGASFTVHSGGGTITFSGGLGTGRLKAGTVNFDNGSSTKGTVETVAEESPGEVNVGTVSTGSRTGQDATGNQIDTISFTQDATKGITQSDGTISAKTISGVIDQSAGTINAGTAALTLGSGSSLGGTVNAGSVSVGNSGTLKLTGNAGLKDTTVTAGILELDNAGTIELNKLSIGTLQGTADSVTATKTGTGALTLGNLTASSLNVTAGGAVTQSGAADIEGAATIAAGNNAVTLTQAGNKFGSIGVTGGNVSITESDAVTLGAISANALSVTAGGNITQSDATTLSGTGSKAVTLNAGANTITLSQGVSGAGTLTLTSNNTGADVVKVSGGTVSAQSIAMGGTAKTLSQSGGNITVSGTSFLTGSDTFSQTGGTASFGSSAATISQKTANTGSITATTLSGNVTQEADNAGTINATTLSGAVTQNAGKIAGKDGGNLTISQVLSAQNGEINASGATLTLASGSEVGGTVTAGNIALSGSGPKTLEQDGADSAITVSGGSFLASGDAFNQKSGTLTLSNSGGNTVNASVTQDGGKIQSQNGSLTFATAVSKNAGTIGTSGQNVTFNGDVTQDGAGKIVGNTVTAHGNIAQTAESGVEAGSLNLCKASEEYKLTGGANNVATLYGMTTAKSIEIDNGTHDLAIGKTAGGNKYGISTTDGLTIKSAGAVTDDGSSVVDGTIKIDSSTSVLLDDSLALQVAGIASSGNVGLKSDSIMQNGAISGAYVTLDQTAGDLTVDEAITATSGDILIRSAGNANVGATTLTAANGNIVVKGAGVAVAGTAADHASLTAKKVGLESTGTATDDKINILNADFVASGGVAAKSATGLTVGSNVTMGKNTAGQTDASLVVSVEGDVGGNLLGVGRPSENLTVAKGNIAFSSDSATPTEITLNRFAYKTATTADAFINFSGAEIGIESAGNVTVNATRADGVTVVSGASSLGGSGTTVEAKDATVDNGKETVDVGNSSGNDNLAGGLIASGDGKTVKLDAVGDVTVAKDAKISSVSDLSLSTKSGKDFTVAQGGTVESTAGAVSITSKGALNVAGNVKTIAKTITLTTEGDDAQGITLGGDVSTYNSGNSGTIVLSSKTGEIEQSAGTVVGYSVYAANQTINQTGNARIEVITTDTGITATKVKQSGGGTVAAVKIAGDFEQTGNGGMLTAYSANRVTVDGKVTQNAANGKIGGDEAGTFNITITKELDQDSGTINANTLTLRDTSTSGGIINANQIIVQTDGAATPDKNLTQDGAGTITVTGADGIKADTVIQSSTGTIKADKIDAKLTQSGGATAKANADDGTITVVGKLTQSGANATLGYAGQNDSGEDVVQNVTLQGGATQQEHGKVLASTLTVEGTGNDYDLSSAEGNAVATITGEAKSVKIHDGTTDLTLQALNVGTGNGNTIEVLKAHDVKLDGATAKKITVAESTGAVTDTENQTAATTVALGDAANQKAVGSVLLKNGTGAIAIDGINAAGNVGVKNASITQNGAISGANVTLDQRANSGTLTVGKNVTATSGDILIRSADEVKVGDDTTPPALSAANGSIVVKGANAVKVQNANLTAKEIGVEATKAATQTDPGATMTLGNVGFVATGPGDGMDGVVLKSGGDMTINDGVAAKTSATATENTAQVTISAGGTLYMEAGNQPTAGEKMSVSAGSLGGINLTSGTYDDNNTVNFKSFVYTEGTDGTDLNFKFTGESLSVKNEKGAVTIQTAGNDIVIEKSPYATGNAAVRVDALDTTAATEGTTDFVEIGASQGDQPEGLEAKGNINVSAADGDTHDLTVNGTVSSTAGTVALKSGGALTVAAGGTVETKAEGMGIILATTGTGDNAKDITVEGATTVGNTTVAAGEVVSKGDLTMTSANDIVLKGTVKTDGNLKMTAANSINQTAGSVTADGEGKTTELTATAGSITLDATTTDAGNNVVPANDFAEITKAVAKNAIKISDKDALTIAGAAGSADGATATTGDIDLKAVSGLTVTAAVNAGGNATLTANEGTLTTAVVETKAGAATLTAGTAASGNTPAKAGTIQANNTITATGGDVIATAQGNVTLTKAVASTDNAVTITAANGGTLDASDTITAADDKAVTATADNGATFGAKVRGGSVSLTANEGTLTTAVVETKAGAAKLTAGTAASGNTAAKAGTIQANDTITATGGDVIATAQGNVTLTKAVASTDNAVTITAANGGAINASDTITAAGDKAVTATADNGATFGATVQGGSVSLTANEGTLETAAIEAKAGAATLVAGTPAGGNDATRAGAIQANDTITATGGDVVATAQGNVTLTKAVASTDNAVTITAANGGAIDASAADATITAADDKAVTATADNGATFGAKVQGGSVSLTANAGTLATDEIEAKAGAATLAAGTIVANGDVKAESGLVSMTATAGDVTTGTVSGQNVLIEATTGVTEGDVVKAAADKFVHTTGGNITIGKDFTAQNAVYKADNGGIIINEKISGVTGGLGLEGQNLTIDGTKISGAETLVVNSKTGDITLSGKPDGVQTLAVAAGGDLTVQKEDGSAVEGDFEFKNGTVSVLDKTAARTISVDGLAAGNDLKVNITGTLTTSGAEATAGDITVDAGTADIGTATAGGAITVDATTATIGNATAGGAATVGTTTGTATVGNLSGTTAAVSSQTGNVVVNGTVTARTGDANVTAANGTITGGGNVVANNGAATASTAANGGVVTLGNVAAGGQATVNGTAVNVASVTGNGTEVTARTGDVNATGVIGQGGATTVTAGGAVTAGSITGTGLATVTAGGNITANGGITGGAGTTVTTGGGAITAGGANIGDGGDTLITANGADVTAGALASGGLLTVNGAGNVAANIAADGDAIIQAGSIEADETTVGGALMLEVGGDAALGTVAIDDDLNGNVDGLLTIEDGTVGSIGGDQDFTTGEFQLAGNLASGAVEMDAGTFQMDGDLDAGGAAVNITAAGGIQGGGLLTAGDLTLAGGDIGAAGNNFRVAAPTLRDITGGAIYLTDESGAEIQIGTITANGELVLTLDSTAGAVALAGGNGLTSNGDMTINIQGPFGRYGDPIRITVNGNGLLTINGNEVADLLHFVLQGDALPTRLIYRGANFAVWRDANGNWKIIGVGPDKERRINRALAFTVNTPELKSAQGIFGNPSFVHTKMNVSEARSMGNMDVLAINNTDFRKTWQNIRRNADVFELDWKPAVIVTGNGPLANKIQSVKSEAEQQPELLPFARRLGGE